MSYLQYNNNYYQLILSGRLPYPYYYPYTSSAPNITNDNCEDCFFNTIPRCPIYPPLPPPYDCMYNYDYRGPHSIPNLCHIGRNPDDEKYDYCLYGITPYQDPSSAMGFTVERLTSSIPFCARHPDPNILEPWGITIVNDVVWVTNTASGLITSYNLLGLPLLPTINVFGPCDNLAQPTGIAFNCNVNAFPICCGPNIEPSNIIVVTRDGTINAYNLCIDPDNSILVVDNSCKNSVYTGLVLVCDKLYATDFYNQRIDVFDCKFKQLPEYKFIDENCDDPIPEDYAPYNIAYIGDFLYVSYAQQSPCDNQYECLGMGKGYINIFRLDGKFIRRFSSCGVLNAPWGMILSPASFGYPAGSIMISNFGDGNINIFDCNGNYINKLRDGCYVEICICGLRGVTINPNYNRILYWVCSENNQKDGTLGTINIRCLA